MACDRENGIQNDVASNQSDVTPLYAKGVELASSHEPNLVVFWGVVP